MFEQTFKNIDDVLWKEAGCTTELDYTEQTSWLLFLKYLDDLEHERAMEAELLGKPYAPIIEDEYQWSVWAATKNEQGDFDHDTAMTGDDLIEFVDGEFRARLGRNVRFRVHFHRQFDRLDKAIPDPKRKSYTCLVPQLNG